MLFNGKKKVGVSAPPSKTIQETGKTVAPETQASETRTPSQSNPSRRPGSTSSSARGAAASTLNSHLTFEGNLKYSGTVVVDCEVRGSIVTDDTLVVGGAGKVEAEISAGVVEVSGKVCGDIKAKKRVKILQGGEVRGNIETPSISMDEGVVFEGNCTRPSPASTSSYRPDQGSGQSEARTDRGEPVAVV